MFASTPTILITGATSGIGKATALLCASQGARVLLHGRTESTSLTAKDEILSQVPGAQLFSLHADLASLQAVQNLALQVREEHPELSLLILNAGVYSPKRFLTEEGFERTWVVNYLSRFLLTHLLLDLLKSNGAGRIIDISGAYHSRGAIHVDDITLAEGYSANTANTQAKLANVLWTYRLARDLKESAITVNTMHPGAVYTGGVEKAEGISPFAKWMYRRMQPFFQTPAKAASHLLYLATDPALATVSGAYFSKRKRMPSAKKTYDQPLQDQLWDLSTEMVGDYLID